VPIAALTGRRPRAICTTFEYRYLSGYSREGVSSPIVRRPCHVDRSRDISYRFSQ